MGTFLKDNLPEPQSYYEAAGLKLDGRGKWRTTACVFHGGSDSMRINMQTGSFVCMAGCGAKGGDVLAYHRAEHGLDFVEACKALGAWQDDGEPNVQRRPAPFPARDALQVLAFESTLVAVAAGNLANGVTLSDEDRLRLSMAAQRINMIHEALQ